MNRKDLQALCVHPKQAPHEIDASNNASIFHLLLARKMGPCGGEIRTLDLLRLYKCIITQVPQCFHYLSTHVWLQQNIK